MPRPSNTEQRKSEIVQALLRVMAKNGYEKASIQAIGKEANLTPGLIHYHFKNKQEILIAMVNWIADIGAERMKAMADDDMSSWQKLECFVNARMATGDGESPTAVLAWVMIASEAIRQPEIKELYEDMIKAQLLTLQQLIGEAWGKPSTNKAVVELSATVLSAMEGAFQLSATASGVMPKGYAAKNILSLIKSTIGEL